MNINGKEYVEIGSQKSKLSVFSQQKNEIKVDSLPMLVNTLILLSNQKGQVASSNFRTRTRDGVLYAHNKFFKIEIFDVMYTYNDVIANAVIYKKYKDREVCVYYKIQ